MFVVLFHDLLEFFPLRIGQLTANFLAHFPEFLADLRADLVPDRLHSFLAVVDNGLDALPLIRRQGEFLFHATGEVAQLGIVREGSGFFGGGIGVSLTLGEAEGNGEAAGNDAGGEDHEGGQNGLPGIHQASG